ncbi:MAG: YsnF/AvaK domain-containing protein, partial [Myxococcota bacterium]|nr:YsnF/AvaK domain-containing protein [Myxococcota bacterium]
AALKTGQVVYSADNQQLGKIVRISEDTIIIEKGFFFPEDYSCAPANVADVREDKVYLSLTRAQLVEGSRSAGSFGSASGPDQQRAGLETKEERVPGAPLGNAGEGDVRIPVTGEEISVEKRMRKAGAVRVGKHVVTEQKTITVPVLREEVSVERFPSTGVLAEGASLRDDSVTVPVMEEEIIVSKRPVVREEVRIKKSQRVEQRAVTAEVQHEEVEIEKEPEESDRRRAVDEDGTAPHA